MMPKQPKQLEVAFLGEPAWPHSDCMNQGPLTFTGNLCCE
jgi:hypothetical protein